MKKNSKSIYVLGTGLSHDGSACLLRDGVVAVAIEKERLTRIKHDGGNDSDAIRYCLSAEGITFDDLTLVVQNANQGLVEGGNDWWSGQRILKDSVPTVSISHHLAHAYSAFALSPFETTAVFVNDGGGSEFESCLDLRGTVVPDQPCRELQHLYFEKDSYYVFKDNQLTPIYKDFSPLGKGLKRIPMYPSPNQHSIGDLYAAVSQYVFGGLDDPGKLMGLAPYGAPGVYKQEIFDLRDSRVFVNYDWMAKFRRPARSYEQFKNHFQYYADIAYWVQKEVERALLFVISSRYEMAPMENLSYSGGVALNAVANRRISTETKFRKVYFQPAAGDNGLALGCAYYGWLEVLKNELVRHDGASSFGRTYAKSDVSRALAKHGDVLEFEEATDPAAKTAQLLAAGKTVGWFQGGCEFGPRALGHRSILADPRNAAVRNFINAKIKFREDFRPFAPSVIQKEVSKYFECGDDYESPYMILVAPVRSEWRTVIPAVIHRDKSARIQTVTEASDPRFHDLLLAFKKITGIPILLNTSFNRKGMPIVETPAEAIDFFLSCALDVLVLDDCIVYKRSKALKKLLPPAAQFGARSASLIGTK